MRVCWVRERRYKSGGGGQTLDVEVIIPNMGALTFDTDWHGSWKAPSSASPLGRGRKAGLGLQG